MNYRFAAVSLCVVFLASCGGSSSSTDSVVEDTTADSDNNAGSDDNASDGDELSDGTIISSIRCVDESLSVVDAEYDVFLDAPKFNSFTRIQENLSASTQITPEDLAVSTVMASMGLAMLSVGTPASYTNNVCNHSLYLAGECELLGAVVDASLTSGALTGTILFPDTTIIDFTIDSADNSSGSMLYTEAGTDNVQSYEWNRSDSGTENYMYTSNDTDLEFEERADCSGNSVATYKDDGTIEGVSSATWSSPRSGDFTVTFESCRYIENVPTCITAIRP